ncbi:MAG: pseudouridine synthase [Acutalibacteraceae bacterium]|nr:pseudouridine synthase [Acutalibacteraceae bacterium]
MPNTRLDKLIASQLNISRKDARSGIRRGLAAVNGETVKNSDFLIDLENDEILYDGQAVVYKKFIYIVMNKPAGVLSASSDKKRETVVDLVPENLRRKGLFPVGRLDKDTTGLLIITDDGDFAHRVLSPQKNIFKTYKAELDGDITEQTLNIFSKEITLADGTVCRRAYFKKLDKRTAEIKICEGRYHQIKRMLGVADLGVNTLERIAIGKYMLPELLQRGECIEVSRSELASVFSNPDDAY